MKKIFLILAAAVALSSLAFAEKHTVTDDQGIIKIVNGPQSLYITDGNETAKIIFTGGN